DDGSPAYRVGERETISEISLRFLGRSSRWIEIYRLNQSTLGDPNKLKPGTILALPADAVEVNVVP
ncbi:MAG TPA: LysM peptidoglycan-binding domain-containing protein, partial [Planctomycetaceae bacterium]|nr:LysM peptidoglycan-binding domain-containing protein [Planctomycetaceae bacterium]